MPHIDPLSFKVQTTLSAYRGVCNLTASANTVKYPAGTTELPIGITLDTVKDTTSAIEVACYGIAKLQFNDTCTSGAKVAVDSSGYGIPFVAISTGGCYLGILVGPKVNATGTIADVLIMPGIDQAN